MSDISFQSHCHLLNSSIRPQRNCLLPSLRCFFFPFQKQPTILFNERHIYEQSNDPHKNFIEGRKNKLLAHDRGRSLDLPVLTLALCRQNLRVTSLRGGGCCRDGPGAKEGEQAAGMGMPHLSCVALSSTSSGWQRNRDNKF